MAMMSHVQLLLLLLFLASSPFLLPVGSVSFEYCNNDDAYDLLVNSIEIVQTPGIPETNFIAAVEAISYIPPVKKQYNYVELLSQSLKYGDDVLSYRLCEVMTPPCNTEGQIIPGTPSTMILDGVKYDNEAKYTVTVKNNNSEPPHVLTCVNFKIDLVAPTLVSAN